LSIEVLEDAVEIANPQHPHCATVLVVDTSGSMAGPKIEQLIEGIRGFKEDVESDELARKRVDLAIVAFGDGVRTVTPFSAIDEFEPPHLAAGGETPMGAALLQGMELIRARKDEYRQSGMDYYRPWLFLITDGVPTDMRPGDPMWQNVVAELHRGEQSKEFLTFIVGVDSADMELLTQLSPPERPPARLQAGRFREMFVWLSKSQRKVSASKVGDQVPLESPLGWAEISTT
jgi:uncharacterized protein YegL